MDESEEAVKHAILSSLKKNRSILVTSMEFDTNFIAREMNSKGLLSDTDYETITNERSVLTSDDKASKIITSLEKKVVINSKYLASFVEILKKKRIQYSDAIELLEAPLMTDSGLLTDTTRSLHYGNVVAVSSEEAPIQSLAKDPLMNATCPIHFGSAAAVETPPPKRIKLDGSSIDMAYFSKKLELHLEKIRSSHEELASSVILLAKSVLKSDTLSSGYDLLTETKSLENKIIADRKKKELMQKQKRLYKGSDIQLLCKHCKMIACSGSDIRITGENEAYFHYVVQAPEFKDKYKTKPHHTPGALTDRIYKTHMIYCKECGTYWGVKCVWSDNRQYPIIKCQCFTFKIEDDFVKVKKWSHAPFEIEPMDENMGYKLL